MENRCERGLAGARGARRAVWSVLVAGALAFFGSTGDAVAREITDAAGRTVTLPEKIEKVCADWPPAMYLVHALDPALLAGINNPFTEKQKEWVSPRVRALPVVGGFFGQARTTNLEALLKVKPDVVVAENWGDKALNSRSEEVLGTFGIPVVYVDMDATRDYPRAFELLGKALGRQERARALSDHGKAALDGVERAVRSIPADRRPRVYYAEGPAGLQTECDTSFHAELIGLAGATNVHHCPKGLFKVRGKEQISLEKVMQYDPDVILAAEPSFFQGVYTDPRWRHVKAVKTRRVYLTPWLLFDWFDRPPSFMRLLGLQWVAWRLYPETYRVDMEKEARRFYSLFLGLEVPPDTMKKLLDP